MSNTTPTEVEVKTLDQTSVSGEEIQVICSAVENLVIAMQVSKFAAISAFLALAIRNLRDDVDLVSAINETSTFISMLPKAVDGEVVEAN